MTIKITFERSSQKGGRQGVEKRVNRGPILNFYCRPKAQEKQHFGKSHFYCHRFFPGNTVTIILDNYPLSTNPLPLGGEKRKHYNNKIKNKNAQSTIKQVVSKKQQQKLKHQQQQQPNTWTTTTTTTTTMATTTTEVNNNHNLSQTIYFMMINNSTSWWWILGRQRKTEQLQEE